MEDPNRKCNGSWGGALAARITYSLPRCLCLCTTMCIVVDGNSGEWLLSWRERERQSATATVVLSHRGNTNVWTNEKFRNINSRNSTQVFFSRVPIKTMTHSGHAFVNYDLLFLCSGNCKVPDYSTHTCCRLFKEAAQGRNVIGRSIKTRSVMLSRSSEASSSSSSMKH